MYIYIYTTKEIYIYIYNQRTYTIKNIEYIHIYLIMQSSSKELITLVSSKV